MKIYEIGTPSHYDDSNKDCDCIIWIKTPDNISIKTSDGCREGVYVKDTGVDYDCAGIDVEVTETAAPNLLKACKEMMSVLERIDFSYFDADQFYDKCDWVSWEKAIDKAEGRR